MIYPMRIPFVSVFLSVIMLSISSGGQTEDVAKRMLPDGNLSKIVMPRASEKDSMIYQLKRARTASSGKDLQRIAFLLALLGADYESNRDFLLDVLRGCDVPEIKHGCDDMTAAYLIYLYRHGHSEILTPLFRSSLKNCNASGAELLGAFLSELIAKTPSVFLDAVSLFSIPKQEQICYTAGIADGGGMAPPDLKGARRKLSAINSELAKRCLRQIEKANEPAKR